MPSRAAVCFLMLCKIKFAIVSCLEVGHFNSMECKGTSKEYKLQYELKSHGYRNSYGFNIASYKPPHW